MNIPEKKLRTIVAGSRDITGPNAYHTLLRAVDDCDWEVGDIISGGARGVDKIGEQFAHNTGRVLSIYEAAWGTLGKKAGYMRNLRMAENADALIAITNGSKGTQHMIDIAKEKGLKVHIVWIK